jgi:hypothetical protein
MINPIGRLSGTIGFFAFVALVAATLGGCVTKSKAQAQARMAYLAGQRAGMMQMQQPRGPIVTFIGRVENPVVTWTASLGLSQGIVNAGYSSSDEPTKIVIHRSGQVIRIDPKDLLNGDDFPLEPGDVVEMRQ